MIKLYFETTEFVSPRYGNLPLTIIRLIANVRFVRRMVRCLLTDETGALGPELEILSFLAKTDQVPLILGFADLLSKFEICFDYGSGKAFARSPSET